MILEDSGTLCCDYEFLCLSSYDTLSKIIEQLCLVGINPEEHALHIEGITVLEVTLTRLPCPLLSLVQLFRLSDL